MTSLPSDLSVHELAVRPPLPEGDLWVFGYGSLMWNPGFEYQECRTARIYGYHRALCVWSHVHRGTPDQPGMVLGLDKGGSCLGRAFRVAAANKQAVAEYLYAREMPTTIYQARIQSIRLNHCGTPLQALTFVVDPAHLQYAGRVEAQRAAQIVAGAIGVSGHSRDYLTSTLEHLGLLGIKDHHLQRIADCLEGLSLCSGS